MVNIYILDVNHYPNLNIYNKKRENNMFSLFFIAFKFNFENIHLIYL